MKKEALLIANSNLFTVYSQSVLQKEYACTVLNVRYPNEQMTKQNHLLRQAEDWLQVVRYPKESSFSIESFHFNQVLTERLDTVLSQSPPHIIFLEMKTLQPAEWLVLDYIHQRTTCPIAVYLPAAYDEEQIVLRLFKNGVKEVITRFEETSFHDIMRRN